MELPAHGTHQFRYLGDGASWLNVGTDQNTYNTGAMNTTTSYRIIVSANESGCSDVVSDTVEVIDNKVQLAIKVPGASRLVRDTITIRSRRLRENQQLPLTFGTPAAAAQ